MNPISLKNGLLLGLITTVLILVLYIFAFKLFVNLWIIPILGTLLAWIFMYRAGYQLTINKTSSTFSSLFLCVLFTFLIGKLINVIFVYFLYHYINPNLSDIVKEDFINFTEKSMSYLGSNEDDIKKAIDKIDNKNFQPNIIDVLRMYLFRSLYGIVYAFMISTILRRTFTKTKL